MPRQPWIADVAADTFRGVKGFRVDTYAGWQTRGNSTFNPEAVMNHHTGPGSYNNLLRYMAVGPVHPPLCNIATSRPHNGVVRITIVAAGRANHAGRGELPWRKNQGSTGNRRTIGIENMNSGSESWPAQQTEAIHMLTAGLLEYMNAGVTRTLDHKDYTSRKWDRHSVNINTTRREVDKILKGINLAGPAPEPEPEPLDPWEEFWMELTDSEKARLKEFAGELAGPDGVAHGSSFARQFLLFNREERHRLREFLDAIDEMNSSPRGQGTALAAMWREAGARGWLRDPERFKENRAYDNTDL